MKNRELSYHRIKNKTNSKQKKTTIEYKCLMIGDKASAPE